MTWLISEIVLFLILAVVLGLIMGWLLGRIGRKNKVSAAADSVDESIDGATDADSDTIDLTSEGLAAAASASADGADTGASFGDTEMEAEIERLKLVVSGQEGQIQQLQAELAPYRTDDLKLIHGVGPVFERSLNGMGYTTYDQIAAWSRDDIREVAAEIDLFPDRIIRDEWIEQAAALATRKANPLPAPSISFAPPAPEDSAS
ncbi:MAG: putative flap endonuclease-1-like 5' DNA nuclease [Candidatus Poriferisodalaceae bacterium]|jgi:predicted flap endonuclease-1-like 5' DNA nuclease